MDDRIRYKITMNAGGDWETFVHNVQIETKFWGRVAFKPDPDSASIVIEIMSPKAFEDLKRFQTTHGCKVTAG